RRLRMIIGRAKPPSADIIGTSKVMQGVFGLIIDGPNCVIGCLPDKTLFMVQDSKKLRPGIVGSAGGVFAFSSEVCGIDAAIPNRDKSRDFQPMKYDTVFVGPEREEVKKVTRILLNPPCPEKFVL
ncbi:MAG: hypothetical protein L7F78_17690, partial [Syntrophales bacterium LBB04]|nr:hypothetical protein [Syntrophales bacterium LBB04]